MAAWTRRPGADRPGRRGGRRADRRAAPRRGRRARVRVVAGGRGPRRAGRGVPDGRRTRLPRARRGGPPRRDQVVRRAGCARPGVPRPDPSLRGARARARGARRAHGRGLRCPARGPHQRQRLAARRLGGRAAGARRRPPRTSPAPPRWRVPGSSTSPTRGRRGCGRWPGSSTRRWPRGSTPGCAGRTTRPGPRPPGCARWARTCSACRRCRRPSRRAGAAWRWSGSPRSPPSRARPSGIDPSEVVAVAERTAARCGPLLRELLVRGVRRAGSGARDLADEGVVEQVGEGELGGTEQR